MAQHIAEKIAAKEFERKRRSVKMALIGHAYSGQLCKQHELDPETFKQAMDSRDKDDWLAGIRDEEESLRFNKVYHVVPSLPRGARLLTSKFVFKRKRDNNGKVVRHKVRLAVRGFTQRAGVDFDETYSPTMAYESVRILCAVAAAMDLELDMLDVKTAYLHAPLDRPQFMLVPQGFTGVTQGAILQLDRALYGLHQSGRLWNRMLDSAIKKLGYSVTTSDACVYTKRARSGRQLTLGVFVDDIPFMYHSGDTDEMQADKRKLMESFQITDLGPIKQILGMSVHRDRKAGTLTLGQEAYIRRVCEKYGITEKTTILTPEFSSVPSSPVAVASFAAQAQLEEAELEQHITLSNFSTGVGLIGFAANSTRPDVAHSYNTLARCQLNPTEQDLKHLHRTLRYLLCSAPLGLQYHRVGKVTLTAFSDADWAGDRTDCKSTTGIVLKIAGAAVAWRSCKQTTTAQSSSESEYVAGSECVRSVAGVRPFLAQLDFAQPLATPVFLDNETAIRMASEEGNAARRKHIDVKYHFIREHVQDLHTVELEWVPTESQEADIMTKPVARKLFLKLRDLVMGHAS